MPETSTFTRGNKFFELSNHLGNVLATVSDKKIGHTSDDTTIDYYNADVVSAQDYYPSGMLMSGRTYSIANTNYRYGFNGKEKDNKDGVVQYDYGFRIYDPRLVKFKSVDPLMGSFPWNSPYSYAENDPINSLDLDGAEKASPGSVDMARQLLKVVGNSIAQAQSQLSKATDKSVKQRLSISMELDKRTYSALMVFIYKNNPTNFDRAADIAIKATPILNEALDITPVGDIKVVATGKNFSGEGKSILGAVGWLALDVFGGEILSGLGKAGRSIKALSGPGKDAIEGIVKKVNNISTALDELHIKAAVNDIFGKPVVINGKAFDHLTEVKNALKGLGNQISELNKVIGNSKVGSDVIESATQLRNTLQKQKNGINSVLDRATNAVKNQ